jgi:hypothetical protein
LLGVLVGIALGFVAGYIHHDVRIDNTAAFSNYFMKGSALRWGVLGALIGGTIIYIQQLLHE